LGRRRRLPTQGLYDRALRLLRWRFHAEFSRQGFAQGCVGDGRDHLPLTFFDGNQFLDFAEIFGLAPRPFSEPVEARLFDDGLRAHQFKL
jgi:hypothetical protein